MSFEIILYNMVSISFIKNIILILKFRDNKSNWVDYEFKVILALDVKGLIRYIKNTIVKLSSYTFKVGV